METQRNNEYKKFPVYKVELAMLYAPEASPGYAVKILRTLINLDSELVDKLEKLNFRKHSHLVTPKQVRLIFEHLGEPDGIMINNH